MNVLQVLNSALVGRYALENEIGVGGMATVYLARDLKHDRQVALKVLRPELGAVLGVERFLAEIRVTANLQHPHLLPLFDSGEAEGLLFYVMPYVKGESLRVRLERESQFTIDEAVRVAIAVASALDYAHRNHVVHRDLKPENILLQDGEPVVSDFGIALAVSNAGGARVTQTGLSLGTPAYMSPEQASGDRVIDARSDVYSLGAVLYEMLIGEPPHTGKTVQQVISRVLTEKPRGVIEQRPTVPEWLDTAVHRALAKLPADRYHTARDFGDALRAGAASASGTRTVRSTLGVAPRPAHRWLAAAPWLLTAVAVAVAAYAVRRPAADNVSAPLVRFSLAPPGGLRSEFADLAVAPDGRRLMVSDGSSDARRVWLRTLGEPDLLELPQLAGTNAHFFSPTGNAVGFVSDGRIRTMPLGGGPSTAVTPVGDGMYMATPTWGAAGTIAYTRRDSTGIWGVTASGGTARRLTVPDSARREEDSSPSFLPDGQRFLFERRTRGQAAPAIMLGALDAPARALGLTGFTPRFSSGYVLWSSEEGALQAVAIDVASMVTKGAPVVLFNIPAPRGPRRANFAVSHTGIMAFIQATPRRSTVVLVDRGGKVTPLVSTPRLYGSPALSPDGRSVAVEVTDGESATDIWIFDSGGTSRRLTSGGRNSSPAWSSDGQAIAYGAQSSEKPGSRLLMQRLDAARPTAELLTVQGMVRPLSFSARGDSVRVVLLEPRQGPVLAAVSVTDGGVSRSAAAPAERAASISPNGRWIVYSATEEGRSHVFIRPFAEASPVTRISDAGGEAPRWSRDGNAVYFRDSTSLVQASLALTPFIRVTERRPLFNDTFERAGMSAYDVGANAQLVMLNPEDPASQVDVLANLATLMRARANAASRAATGR